jgi:hypothetical protein
MLGYVTDPGAPGGLDRRDLPEPRPTPHQAVIEAARSRSSTLPAAAPGGRLQGFWVYRTGEETFGEDLGILAGLIADGRLSPRLGVVRDWSGTVEAVEALRSRQATGKVVLTRS